MTTLAPRLPNSARRSLRRVLGVLVGALFVALGPIAQVSAQPASGPSLVVLVRHGEKATEPAGDPALSAAGQERASALIDALVNVQPSAIIVSATRRTEETAAPLAAKYRITPQIIALTGGGALHVAAVAAAVRKQRGVVVVVGHSNTVPAIIRALGGPALPDLCDTSYATLFLLQPTNDGSPAQLVRAQFGASDSPNAGSCAPVQGRRVAPIGRNNPPPRPM